jgi:Bacterial protein of unknown function (DUF937)/PRC-barrel domain
MIMADNIVASVSRFLTPELIGKLTSAANLDRNVGQRATAAIVPAILSGLAGVAGTPAGSRQLANVVAQQPGDMLGKFVSSLTGSAPQTAAKGVDVLSTLLGGGALGLLTSTLSKFLAVGEAPTRSLMGLLTPLIMGVLGQQQKATGVDANGLARMLTQQKEEITDAMPPGLASLLESSGLYHRVSAPSVTNPPMSDIVRGSPTQRMAGDGARARGATWAYWVLPLLALAGLLSYLVNRGGEPVHTANPPNVAAPIGFLAKAPSDWVPTSDSDYTNQAVYTRSGESLGTIKGLLKGTDGKIAVAVISVSRVLGIGEKDVAVPLSALKTEQLTSGRRIVLDVTKDGLQLAPAFQR